MFSRILFPRGVQTVPLVECTAASPSPQEGSWVPLPPKHSRNGAPVLLLHLSQTLPLPSLSFPSGRCYKRCSASMSSFPFQATVKGPQGGGDHTRVTFRFQTAGHPQLIPAWSLTEKGTGPCPPLWSLPLPDKLLLKVQLASGMGGCLSQTDEFLGSPPRDWEGRQRALGFLLTGLPTG